MAIGKTKKDKTVSKKGDWKRLGSVRNSDKFDGQYVKVDDDATLIYVDPESGRYYKVKSFSIFDPHGNAPDFISANLSINLNNEYHVELADDDTDDE